MKTSELRELAMQESIPEVKYKSTVHGKNRDTLIAYIQSVKKYKEFTPDPAYVKQLSSMTKDELLLHCSRFHDFKKSFHHKDDAFLVDFLARKGASDTEWESEARMRELLSCSKEDLVMIAKQSPQFQPKMERKTKQWIAEFIVKDPSTLTDPFGDGLSFMNIAKLKLLASAKKGYDENTHGKSRVDVLSFLRKPIEEEDDGAVSPLHVHDFFIKPNAEELRDALTKILTSHESNLM